MIYLVQDGWAALHIAAKNDHLRVVQMLLEANADFNIKTNVSFNALRVHELCSLKNIHVYCQEHRLLTHVRTTLYSTLVMQ